MSEPVTAKAVIKNPRGLHARASARFCAVAASWDADITVTKDGQTVGGTSIMGLMMLGAGPGAELVISATGAQARDAVDTLLKLIADQFGERE
ncbi:MAG: HPr family phosphocarrier protein [Parvularculaceae bacterium]